MKKYPFEVPSNKILRVIIDTDAACEGDDQYAITHALLTPKFDIRGIVAEHFCPMLGDNSMEKSYNEIIKVLTIMGLQNTYPVYKGVVDGLKDEKTPEHSPAAEFIVKEALKDEKQPLFVVCQGALSNVADALLIEPKIADRMNVIWIGGGAYPEGEWEFNCCGDVNAVNIVMDSSVPLWQVPSNVYFMMKVSFTELYEKVYPCGEIGKYLFENLMRVNKKLCATKLFGGMTTYPGGESWQLGDSPVVGLLLTDHTYNYDMVSAPRVNAEGHYLLRPANKRKIRVYKSIDARFILNDMYAKLAYQYGK
jgi:inosine-uridine nucleoside N-ribohydrolase